MTVEYSSDILEVFNRVAVPYVRQVRRVLMESFGITVPLFGGAYKKAALNALAKSVCNAVAAAFILDCILERKRDGSAEPVKTREFFLQAQQMLLRLAETDRLYGCFHCELFSAYAVEVGALQKSGGGRENNVIWNFLIGTLVPQAVAGIPVLDAGPCNTKIYFLGTMGMLSKRGVVDRIFDFAEPIVG